MPGLPDRNTAFAVTGSSVAYTLTVGSVVCVLLTTLYSFVHWRKVWPRVYSPRTFLYPTRTPIENPNRYFFSWFWEIYNISEDEILRTVGLDALVFLRMQRLYGVLFVLSSLYGLGVLLPLNLLYGNPATNDYYNFARTTMANLPPRDRIKNIHVYRANIAGAWLFTALSLGLLAYEYRRFIKLRFLWLTLPRTHNYSIMVSHIPYSMRSVAVLKAFFDRILAPHGLQHDTIGRVLSVTLTMDLHRVETLVRERERVREKLEHLMAVAALATHTHASAHDHWTLVLRNWCFAFKTRDKWIRSLAEQIRVNAKRLNYLNEAVDLVQQETRRLYYGYDNVDNFGVSEQDSASALLAATVTHGPSARHVRQGHGQAGARAGGAGQQEGDVGRGRGQEKKEEEQQGDEETGHATPQGQGPAPSSCVPASSPERQARGQGQGQGQGQVQGGSSSRHSSPGKTQASQSQAAADEEQGAAGDEGEGKTDVASMSMAQEGSSVASASVCAMPDVDSSPSAKPAPPPPLASSPSATSVLAVDPQDLGAGVEALLPGTSYRMRPIGNAKYGSFACTRRRQPSQEHLRCRDRDGEGQGRPPLAADGGLRREGVLSARSRNLLNKFFSRPICSETFGTAFVTVSTLEACAMLRQCVTYQKPFEMTVEEAPLSEDIMWHNMDSNLVASSLRIGIGHVLTLLVTGLFFVPTAFISALNSVETMKQYFPDIDEYLRNKSEVQRVNKSLALISPILLLILISIIPPIFGVLTRAVIRDSRTISESHSLIYQRYFGFLFYNALLVFVVTQGVYETIKRTYDNPSQVLNQIGATLPKPAAFFINFILIKTFMGLPTELIRSTNYLQHALKILFVDDLTEAHRRRHVLGCPSVTHPGGFHYGRFLAEHTLIFVYVMCYSCLAPLILPVGFAFFAGSYIVYKRQLLFVYEPEYETGGKMFKLIFKYTFTGLFVSHFVMLCMLITKFAYEDLPFFLPLPVLTYFAMDVMSKWFGRLESHVPLYLAVTKDMKYWTPPGHVPATPSGELLDLARDTYHHPAIRTPWAELPRPSPEAVADALDASLAHGTARDRGRDRGRAGAQARAASHGTGGANASLALAANTNALTGVVGGSNKKYIRVNSDVQSSHLSSSEGEEEEEGDDTGSQDGEDAYMRRLSL